MSCQNCLGTLQHEVLGQAVNINVTQIWRTLSIGETKKNIY
jgi:hypothetical protein